MFLHILINYVFFCLFSMSMLYQNKSLCLTLNVEIMKRRQPHGPVKNWGTLAFFFKQPVTFLLCQNTLLLVYLGVCRRTPKSQCTVFVQQQGILQNEEKSAWKRRLGRHQMAAWHNRPYISGRWLQLWCVCDAGNKNSCILKLCFQLFPHQTVFLILICNAFCVDGHAGCGRLSKNSGKH